METKKENLTNKENISQNKNQTKNTKINKKKAETSKFKSKYFEFYDDIKISDRQDW